MKVAFRILIASSLVAFFMGAPQGVLLGCGGEEGKHVENAIESSHAAVQYDQCRVEAHKADGGLASFCACVIRVDTEHHIDGGACP